jgi:hypothetical protein
MKILHFDAIRVQSGMVKNGPENVRFGPVLSDFESSRTIPNLVDGRFADRLPS